MSRTSGPDAQECSMPAPFALPHLPGCGDPISAERMPRSICQVTHNPPRRTAQGTRKTQVSAVPLRARPMSIDALPAIPPSPI